MKHESQKTMYVITDVGTQKKVVKRETIAAPGGLTLAFVAGSNKGMLVPSGHVFRYESDAIASLATGGKACWTILHCTQWGAKEKQPYAAKALRVSYIGRGSHYESNPQVKYVAPDNKAWPDHWEPVRNYQPNYGKEEFATEAAANAYLIKRETDRIAGWQSEIASRREWIANARKLVHKMRRPAK